MQNNIQFRIGLQPNTLKFQSWDGGVYLHRNGVKTQPWPWPWPWVRVFL